MILAGRMIEEMFPAQAGMNRHHSWWYDNAFNVPRTGGDEPAQKIANVVIALCSPHRRG